VKYILKRCCFSRLQGEAQGMAIPEKLNEAFVPRHGQSCSKENFKVWRKKGKTPQLVV
jgi:hypothetical protein